MKIVKYFWLLFGGTIRCAACGHPVTLMTLVPHCRVRHPEEMP